MTAAISALKAPVVRIDTHRFGVLEVPVSDLYTFPRGLPGFEGLDQFALLAIREGLGWLQSVEVPSLAFLVVQPHRVGSESWATTPGAWAIVTLGHTPEQCTVNLRAPLILNVGNRLGVQWIGADSTLSTAQPVNLLDL